MLPEGPHTIYYIDAYGDGWSGTQPIPASGRFRSCVRVPDWSSRLRCLLAWAGGFWSVRDCEDQLIAGGQQEGQVSEQGGSTTFDVVYNANCP
jgi:hypothetical protein